MRLRVPVSFARLPPHSLGLRVGLFGGSFNPAHQGHLHASKLALKRLRLDRVWWLVTPGNPLKDTSGLPPLAVRVAAARGLTRDPRIVVTGLEAEIGTRYTFETIAYLHRRCTGVRFVWIMGSDIVGQFHRWQRWRDIAQSLPLAIIDRPGATWPTLGTPAAHWLAGRRLPEREAALLVEAEPPAFVFLHGPRIEISSSLLRQASHSPANFKADLRPDRSHS